MGFPFPVLDRHAASVSREKERSIVKTVTALTFLERCSHALNC